ncbi:MAG: hypothetical protein KAT71_08350 [Gammaproteobacteria bacterium]|nr:hypothetical protein [Gammaproteobacteria bacterium]
MSTTEERLAVLESVSQRNESDINALFTELRKHAQDEEEGQAKIMELISEIREEQGKQKSFVGGVAWSIGAVGVAVIAGIQAAWKYFST